MKSSILISGGASQTKRCKPCGRFVGEVFTGYSADKTSKREPLLCESCVRKSLLEGAP